MPDRRTATALDALLGFSNPNQCLQAPAHDQLLAKMVSGGAEKGFHQGTIAVEGGLRRAFGPIAVEQHEHYTVASVPVSGTLFGLPLVSIQQALPHGGDPGDVTYTFEATDGMLEQALQARGFPAKAGKDVAIGPPDGYDRGLHLAVDPTNARRAMFTCYHR